MNSSLVCVKCWSVNGVSVSPCESGIVDVQPSPRIKRGLTLMCKIMQNIANHVLFTKELHMRPFNDFLKTNFDAARRSVFVWSLLLKLCIIDSFIHFRSRWIFLSDFHLSGKVAATAIILLFDACKPVWSTIINLCYFGVAWYHSADSGR